MSNAGTRHSAKRPREPWAKNYTKQGQGQADIPEKEGWKIRSAERFFGALQAQGIPVSYKTKINGDQLSQLIAEINPTIPQKQT